MKLITPAVAHDHNVTIQNSATAQQVSNFVGRISISFCKIDFEDTPFMLGQLFQELRFGNTIYRGVRPLRWNENEPTVAECAVQQVENV